jgi:tetratricopeptide (TPR) repeat protein
VLAWTIVSLVVTPCIARALPSDGQDGSALDVRGCAIPGVVRRVSRTTTSDITSVGITYFAGRSRGGDDAHLAAALTRELAVQLLSARIRVDSSKREPAAGRLLTVRLSEGGGFADVALSLTGAVFREGDLLRTSVKLTRTVDGAVLWSGTKIRPIQELPILARLVAQEVAVRIGAQLTAPSPRSAAQRSSEIYELILRGTYIRSRYDPTAQVEAISYLDQALSLDSSAALARTAREQAELRLLTWGGNGDALEASLRSRGMLRRVLERTRDESERLIDEADAEIRDGQSAHACQLLNTAIDLDGRAAPAYALRAIVRARGGEVREAFGDAETVSQLGRPRWGDALRVLVANRAGDTTTARRQARRIIAEAKRIRGPLSFWDARLMAAALTEARYPSEAQALLRRIDASDPRVPWLRTDPLLVRASPPALRRRRGG